MNRGISYDQFYSILLNLREEFHKNGRIDDSNKKLDEILKLLMISYSLARKGKRFSLEYVMEYSNKKYKNENKIAKALKSIFKEESTQTYFINNDGTNIFGDNPSLSLNDTEDEFAELLISEISKIDFYNLFIDSNSHDFDVINECFGHFVRDNFRNNKEDGQYMTPAEISKPIAKLITKVLIEDKECLKKIENVNFSILDPTCGVGTLLIELENEIANIINNPEKYNKFKKECVYGQDKIERMVRMTKMNFLLLNNNISNVYVGNSISEKSNIDNLKNKIDLIISNPPFGAEFSLDELDVESYPFIKSLNGKYKKIKSEILILDKSIDLLKENGYLCIILPDGVFSSKGIYEDLRNFLLNNYDIKWILDLPSVAFAQAGTRTNTSVILIKKCKSIENKINMIVCENLGYDVKERMGVPVKFIKGENDLNLIVDVLSKKNKNKVISEKPSIVSVQYNELIGNILKPNFYSATRIKALDIFDVNNKNNIKIIKLKDVVQSVTKNRKSFMVNENMKHISILHVDEDGVIDIKEMLKFNPISKGREVFENDILFSKINPRISRICVVPKLNFNLVCSNEFEILQPKRVEYSYLLCRILKMDFVQKQIESLTSGTSSSHNRIKTEQLLELYIPDPESFLNNKNILNKIKKAEESIKQIYNSKACISELDNTLSEIIK